MNNSNETKPQGPNRIGMINFAMEFGYIIALPLVAFGLAGKWLDAKFGTEPWLTLIAILLAITATTVWLTRRIKQYLK